MRRILQGHYVTAKRSRVAPTRRLPAIPCKTLRTRCRLRWPQGRRLCYDSKQLRNARRRAFQVTPQFQQDYRFPAGVEAAMSQFDRRTGVKQLRVRGFKTSLSVLFLKLPELTSSGLLRSATAKTAAFQTRYARLAFFTLLYTPVEGRSTSSEAGSPLFWSKSGFCPHSPIVLSLRKRGALSYCGTINFEPTALPCRLSDYCF